MAAPNIISGDVFPEHVYEMTIPVSSLANLANSDIIKRRINHPFRIEDIRWRTGDKVPADSSGTDASITFTPKISGTAITCGTITIGVTGASDATTIGAGISLSSPITGNNTGGNGDALWLSVSGVSAFTAGSGSGWFEVKVVNTAPGANYQTNKSVG